MIDVISWIKDTNVQATIIGPAISLAAFQFHRINARKCHIGELIQEIETLAVEHWCNPGTDTNNHFRAIKIQDKIQTLSWKINQNSSKKRTALVDYRKAVTGGNFDDPNRTLINFEEPRIILIKDKARSLRKVLGIKKHH